MAMGILSRKLGHFIRRNLGQFLAATAVVTVGIIYRKTIKIVIDDL
jgi:hypothetical protein